MMVSKGFRQRQAFFIGLMALFLFALHPASAKEAAREADPAPQVNESFVIGKVKSVSSGTVDERLMQKTGIVSRHQLVETEIMDGAYAGKIVVIPNEITDNPAYNISPSPGRELVLSMTAEGNGKPEFYIADYHRAPVIYALIAVFLALFLLFGGKKGVKSLAGLAICIALVALVLLPASMHGFNPLLAAAGICILATASTICFVAGFSQKAAAAVLGTGCGVVISGIVAEAVIILAPLTGLTSEEAQILRGSVLAQPPEFYSGLLAAGMLIGALGVIMDVGISIASTIAEVANTDRSLSFEKLYKAGMNVGRDIMGTMTTTLVLAYAGGAMPLLMLVSLMPSTKLLNLDLVATEVTAAVSGSLGLVCTIPLTAFFAAKLMSSKSDVDPDNFLKKGEGGLLEARGSGQVRSS